ncbi:MAG: TIGR04283 family arsenosugar biosynthesis glycosyltransferase, partial [Elainella sp.]
QAKTRLIPALGATGAAELQRQMTEHTLAQVQQLQAQQPCSVEVWFAASGDGGSSDSAQDQQLMQSWLGDWIYLPQIQGDLGAKLSYACQTAFQQGSQRVIAIGTDCPGLDAARMQQAFELLQTHDLVLGPATDGGYYLIGLRQFVPELFESIRWSSEVVLQQTVAVAESLGLSIAYLDWLTDVDRPEDLAVWEAVQTTRPDVQPKPPDLSVILPVLNEAAAIQDMVRDLRRAADLPIEIIAVDGGSRDGTVERLRALDIQVLETTAGRALQMNAGAKAASGEILLFLHADTRLPEGFVTLVEQVLAQPKTLAGAFDLKIAGSESQAGLRWIERGVGLRSRWLQLPYGDQAIFLRAETFWQLGGFAPLPIMEDYDLVQRLKRQGRIAIAPAAVVTSGRRWQKLGLVWTTLLNQFVIVAYWLGVPPARLANWYRAGGLSLSGWAMFTAKRAEAESGSDPSNSSN